MQGSNQTSNQESSSDYRQSPKSAVKDQKRLNMRGDVYAMNAAGQISTFRFTNTEVTYSFAYDDKGELSAMASSAGWTWTKTNSDEFRGWVVRNYFDLWQVSEEDTGSVYVNQTGIHATGKKAEMMALPQGSLN